MKDSTHREDVRSKKVITFGVVSNAIMPDTIKSVLYILTTPVKRLFSIAVKVLHRRLTDKTFEMLMFVRCNESMLRAQN